MDTMTHNCKYQTCAALNNPDTHRGHPENYLKKPEMLLVGFPECFLELMKLPLHIICMPWTRPKINEAPHTLNNRWNCPLSISTAQVPKRVLVNPNTVAQFHLSLRPLQYKVTTGPDSNQYANKKQGGGWGNPTPGVLLYPIMWRATAPYRYHFVLGSPIISPLNT